MWIGSVIYPLMYAVLVFALVRRRVWKDAVFVSLVLWIAGYFAFLIYHANLQPRYYLVIAVPMTLLVVRGAQHALAWRWQSAYVLAPAMLLLVAHDAKGTLHYLRHPEYTFQNAAIQVGKIVESEPNHSHTVLSISGSDLTLMTGLPSICDDFGTMQLEDRIAAYKPGWFVAWNYVEDDKMEALAKFYRLTRVAEFPAMDDPDRNLIDRVPPGSKAGCGAKAQAAATGVGGAWRVVCHGGYRGAECRLPAGPSLWMVDEVQYHERSMTGVQTFEARAALGTVAAIATVAAYHWQAAYRASSRSFNRAYLAVFAAVRLLLFSLIFLVLRLPVRGDLPSFYMQEAWWRLEGKVPYRDFLSSYAPLSTYLYAAVYRLHRSPVTLVLFAVLVEIAAAALWLKVLNRVAPQRLARRCGFALLVQSHFAAVCDGGRTE